MDELTKPMAGDHTDLILEPNILTAMKIKYDRGRARYGDAEWVGPPPLECAHDEILDFLVYVKKHYCSDDSMEGIMQGMGFELMKQGMDLIQGIRVAIKIERDLESGKTGQICSVSNEPEGGNDGSD